MPLGSLRAALWYPNLPDHKEDASLLLNLSEVGLQQLSEQLDEERDWTQTLSVGELQRCAFVRALMTRPAVLFMDESSSALDAANEMRCYHLIKQSLPATILISIGHRDSLKGFHRQLLDLNNETWRDGQKGNNHGASGRSPEGCSAIKD